MKRLQNLIKGHKIRFEQMQRHFIFLGKILPQIYKFNALLGIDKIISRSLLKNKWPQITKKNKKNNSEVMCLSLISEHQTRKLL